MSYFRTQAYRDHCRERVAEKATKVLKYVIEYDKEEGKSPTLTEIQLGCDISYQYVIKILNKLKDEGMIDYMRCKITLIYGK